jgi:hypothetical protein
MKTPLLPLTRLVLIGTALTLTVFAIIEILVPALIRSVLWPVPFEPVPDAWLRYNALTNIGLIVASLYILRQNDWAAARPYLISTVVLNGLDILYSVLLAVSTPVPAILWLYVVLAVIYVIAIIVAWRQQSAASPS